MISVIYSALNQHLLNVVNVPIVWENAQPPATLSSPWLSVNFIPSSCTSCTLGDGGLNEFHGVYQIGIHTDTDTGWMAAHKLADKIQQHFSPCTVYQYDDQQVKIDGVNRSGGRIENGWFRVTLSLNWCGYCARSVV